jgi:hypothetical protein
MDCVSVAWFVALATTSLRGAAIKHLVWLAVTVPRLVLLILRHCMMLIGCGGCEEALEEATRPARQCRNR